MNRLKLMLCMAIVAAVTVLVTGTGITYAAPASPATAAPAAVTPPPSAASRAAAIRARAQRDAAIKKRQEAKQYIQKVIDSQQPGAAAPGNAGKEGAK